MYSNFPTLEDWQQKLVMTIIDEAQQYGGDREVATVAMLPPTCLLIWTGDAQQTPDGIAKGPDQIAISRRQLMMRKHGLRCPQTEFSCFLGYPTGDDVLLILVDNRMGVKMPTKINENDMLDHVVQYLLHKPHEIELFETPEIDEWQG